MRTFSSWPRLSSSILPDVKSKDLVLLLCINSLCFCVALSYMMKSVLKSDARELPTVAFLSQFLEQFCIGCDEII